MPLKGGATKPELANAVRKQWSGCGVVDGQIQLAFVSQSSTTVWRLEN